MASRGPRSVATKKRIGDAQRRSWAERRGERSAAIKQGINRPEVREHLRQARRRQYGLQTVHARLAALELEQASRKPELPVLRGKAAPAKPARPERMETTSALQLVHARITARDLEQARTPPKPQRQPARLWNLSAHTAITHTAEPPPMPEMQGWQKILCGRLG
jgi:hypothetical protein